MGSPSRNVHHPPRLSEDRLNLPQPHSPSLPTHCTAPGNRECAPRGLLKRARVDEVITALRELCRGRTAGKIRTHLNYFLKNRHRFAYTTMVGLGLPRGSGAVESAIRRVINLRIKGASIYWLPESVDAILLLRSFYKSGRWNCLQRMAMTPVGVSA